MDAWGYNSFENEDAMDWLADLIDLGDAMIDEAFERIEDSRDDTLSSDFCACAIAAAEVVAALHGKPALELPEELIGWLKGHTGTTSARLQAAKKAVLAIRQDSGLRDDWSPSDDFEAWQAGVDKLISRLN